MRSFFSIPNSQTLNPEVVKHFRRNFFVNLLDAGFWFIGDSFVVAYTIFPVFINTLTDSPVIIRMMPVLADAGWFLPQLFFARYLEGKNRRLPIVLKLGIFNRPYFIDRANYWWRFGEIIGIPKYVPDFIVYCDYRFWNR